MTTRGCWICRVLAFLVVIVAWSTALGPAGAVATGARAYVDHAALQLSQLSANKVPALGSFATYDPDGTTRSVRAGNSAGTPSEHTQAYNLSLSPLQAWIVAENSGNRVFWSGGDVAKNAAVEYARASGSKSLEMTLKGRALQKSPQGMVPRKAWDLASGRFARGANGEAHVLFGSGAPWPSSTFSRVEAPILYERGNPIMQHFLDVP